MVFKRNGVPAGLLNSDSQNTSWGGVGANPNNAGAFNTANGYQALYSNTIGIDNTATGYAALGGNTTGESNTAVGYQALGSNATGNYNTALGYRAGDSGNFNIQGTGSNNILIGYNAQPSSYAVSNEVTLGNPNNNVYRMYAASWTNASDRKLKHDIAEIPVGLNFVKALKPVSYIYNSSTTATKTLGFVAQDVQEAMRANTLGKEYGLVNQLDKDHLGLNTTELIPVLTKAIQEQQTQIETQQKQIEMHQKQIEAQNALIEKLGKRLETLERKP